MKVAITTDTKLVTKTAMPATKSPDMPSDTPHGMPDASKSIENRSGMDQKRLQMLEQVQMDAPSSLGVLLRAYSSNSKGAAIKAFCLECLWMDRQAIRGCDVTNCPLWNVRPFQKVKKPMADAPHTA